METLNLILTSSSEARTLSWTKFDLDRAKLEARLNLAHNFHDLNEVKRSDRINFIGQNTLTKDFSSLN